MSCSHAIEIYCAKEPSIMKTEAQTLTDFIDVMIVSCPSEKVVFVPRILTLARECSHWNCVTLTG